MAKKKETITEELARMSAREFADVHKELVALRQDIGDIRGGQQDILHAIEGLELKVSAYASSWSRDFDRLHEWVNDHEKRVLHVEKKLRLRR